MRLRCDAGILIRFPVLWTADLRHLPWKAIAKLILFGRLNGGRESFSVLSAKTIVELHDQRTRAWHLDDPGSCEGEDQEGAAPEQNRVGEWLTLIACQHRANFDLWHIEDEARSPGATDAELAAVKRRIDKTNQLRNDLVEQLDGTLLKWLAERALPREDAPLNSESPGLIIDRLSILSL